ncbi:DUF5069 domain-containing protein [Luteolibacter yonseiensis]|uniref:DUF5069 domain-containing protein n=1 Tax=Luteolibacter yonseiensis TaxID=1144680 RepID=A0A934R464_9BACT|nr:DUF5069 domain-containing protein [Luteolibacter yonseiensis]MBK1816584.1 DUF5069 domain-containing protein [Luteolibacter yonseiensis]
MSTAKDLTKEAPTSPRVRTAGYAILARMADKGRATLAGTVGEFHFDCPLDNFLFGFKGVQGSDVKKLLEDGASNEEIAAWLDANGTPKTEEEKTAWSDSAEAARPYDNPEKKEWFIGVCKEAGVDPATSTLFDYLEADDKASYAK